MTLPTDYVDGDVLTAADVNAITTAVNAITPKYVDYTEVVDTTTRSTNATSYTDSGISLTYTPVNASNTLIIEAVFTGSYSMDSGATRSSRRADFRIYDSNNSAQLQTGRIQYATATAVADPSALAQTVCMVASTTANSTSARTYKIQYQISNAADAAGISAGSTSPTYLRVTEIAP